MGLILKYQIYQSFAEEMESDESDLVKHIATHNDRLRLVTNNILLFAYVCVM